MKPWPELPVNAWTKSRQTLHLFAQVVGKVVLARTPLVNHWWNAGFSLTERGLETELIHDHGQNFQLGFDFQSHLFTVIRGDGTSAEISLDGISVAEFYRQVMERLREIGMETAIWSQPVEIAGAIPFEQDTEHQNYDGVSIDKFWRTLQRVDAVFQEFRAEFMGKNSPNLLWWGSLDFSTSRFSGRTAPPNTYEAPFCGPHIMLEAYSREIHTVGYWPDYGDEGAFFTYFYPAPEGFKDQKLEPAGSFYDEQLGEFVLPYELVRTAEEPEQVLLSFMRSSYEVGSKLANWDNQTLLRS